MEIQEDAQRIKVDIAGCDVRIRRDPKPQNAPPPDLLDLSHADGVRMNQHIIAGSEDTAYPFDRPAQDLRAAAHHLGSGDGAFDRIELHDGRAGDRVQRLRPKHRKQCVDELRQGIVHFLAQLSGQESESLNQPLDIRVPAFRG